MLATHNELHKTRNCYTALKRTMSKSNTVKPRLLEHGQLEYPIARTHWLTRCFVPHIIVVGAIFTSQNRPKCEFNSHFGRFRLVKMVPTTSSYQSLTVLYISFYFFVFRSIKSCILSFQYHISNPSLIRHYYILSNLNIISYLRSGLKVR